MAFVAPISQNRRDDMRAALAAVLPRIRDAVLGEAREPLVQRVGEWALGLLTKDEVTTDDWAELRQLVQITDPPDADDPCVCGHARHEHHTWNENASVGCAHCGCDQFRLDLVVLKGAPCEPADEEAARLHFALTAYDAALSTSQPKEGCRGTGELLGPPSEGNPKCPGCSDPGCPNRASQPEQGER